MNENAKKKAHKDELLSKLSEKYDKKEEMSPEKKAVLLSWVTDVEKLSEKYGFSEADDKQKALVLKMARQIEERERKRGRW